MSETGEQQFATGVDSVTARILFNIQTKKKPDARKGVRREGRHQIQGYLPPTVVDILDELAGKLEVTKHDLLVMAVNEVLERMDARVTPLSGKQEAETARRAELELLDLDPNASHEQIERVRRAAVEDLRNRHGSREGTPFRLKLEKDERDAETVRMKKKTSMGFTAARAYGTIDFKKAKVRAMDRLEAFQLYKERGLADMSKTERIDALKALRSEHPDLAVMIDKWLTREEKGKQATTQVPKSREGRRSFSAWIEEQDFFEFGKLTAGGLGGAPTKTHRVVMAGSRLLILNNLDVLGEDELTEEQKAAIEILWDGDMDDVFHTIDATPAQREEWLAAKERSPDGVVDDDDTMEDEDAGAEAVEKAPKRKPRAAKATTPASGPKPRARAKAKA